MGFFKILILTSKLIEKMKMFVQCSHSSSTKFWTDKLHVFFYLKFDQGHHSKCDMRNGLMEKNCRWIQSDRNYMKWIEIEYCCRPTDFSFEEGKETVAKKSCQLQRSLNFPFKMERILQARNIVFFICTLLLQLNALPPGTSTNRHDLWIQQNKKNPKNRL